MKYVLHIVYSFIWRIGVSIMSLPFVHGCILTTYCNSFHNSHLTQVYLSGQIGLDPNTSNIVKGGIKAEARQALRNMGRVLKWVKRDLIYAHHTHKIEHIIFSTGHLEEASTMWWKPRSYSITFLTMVWWTRSTRSSSQWMSRPGPLTRWPHSL